MSYKRWKWFSGEMDFGEMDFEGKGILPADKARGKLLKVHVTGCPRVSTLLGSLGMLEVDFSKVDMLAPTDKVHCLCNGKGTSGCEKS